MNKNINIFILCHVFSFALLSGGCRQHINYFNLDADTEFVVRRWSIILPDKYSPVLIDSLHETDYETFRALLKTGDHLNVDQSVDYLDLSFINQPNAAASCYAYCYINSDESKTVVFAMGIDNDAKVWVNDSLYLAEHAGNITKNDFAFKVSLKKGNNLVTIKISSDKDAFGFHCSIISPATANKYLYGRNFCSISKHCLVPEKQSLDIIIQNACHDTSRATNIQFFSSTNEVVLENNFAKGKSWSIDLSRLKTGPYKCRLQTNGIRYEQSIVYGDYKHLFAGLSAALTNKRTQADIQLNIQGIISRFTYLEAFGQRNGYDQVLERKMSDLLFELQRIKDALQANVHPFTNSTGYHIMSYRSDIDGTINHYAVYIPENLDPLNNIPIVMVVPWVAKQNPFTESWHLAFTDRIEFMEHLAQKYKCAVMWQSARVYEKYNFNPIVNTAFLESLQDLKKYYKIDTNRLYAYGTCSGGTQALLLALHHPSLFAAVGAEGPELSYLEGKVQEIPKIWATQNNMITGCQNYTSTPLFIANSINDWHGGKEPEMTKFLTALKATGVSYDFQSMGNPTVSQFVKMRDDNKITDELFAFLTKHTKTSPRQVQFTVSQLKYNKSYWLSIDSRNTNADATVKAILDANKISLTTDNVRAFSLYPDEFPEIKTGAIKIYINEKYYQTINIEPSGKPYIFQLSPVQTAHQKDHFTEGPINHFFADKFYLVKKADNSFTIPADSFSANWQYNFFGNCYSKAEKDISYQELARNNILLFGTHSSNRYIRQMLDSIPLRIENDTIIIFNKKWTGKNLTIKMIYPNPFNSKKYLLVIAGTGNYINNAAITDLPLKGWNDIEITDDASDTIYTGDFNQYWKL